VWKCTCISDMAEEIWRVHKGQKFPGGFDLVAEYMFEEQGTSAGKQVV